MTSREFLATYLNGDLFYCAMMRAHCLIYCFMHNTFHYFTIAFINVYIITHQYTIPSMVTISSGRKNTSLTAWFFVLAASQRTRQHLRRRRIFPKSAGVARKSREVTGSHPDLCNTVPGIVFAVGKFFLVNKYVFICN